MLSSPGTPSTGLNIVMGSYFRCCEQGLSNFKWKNSQKTYQNSEAGAPGAGILTVCVCECVCLCVFQVHFFFLVGRQVVILRISPGDSEVGGQWTLLRNFTSRTCKMLKIKQTTTTKQNQKEPIKC